MLKLKIMMIMALAVLGILAVSLIGLGDSWIAIAALGFAGICVFVFSGLQHTRERG